MTCAPEFLHLLLTLPWLARKSMLLYLLEWRRVKLLG